MSSNDAMTTNVQQLSSPGPLECNSKKSLSTCSGPARLLKAQTLKIFLITQHTMGGKPGKRGCFLLPEALSVRILAGTLYCTSGSSGRTSVYTCMAGHIKRQQDSQQSP